MNIDSKKNEFAEKTVTNRFLTLLFFKKHQQILPFFLIILVFMLPLVLFVVIGMAQAFLRYSPVSNSKALKNPTFTFKTLMNGHLQKDTENWFNTHNPLKSWLTTVNNQFYYSFFSKSLMFNSGIIIGKKGYLYEKIYTDHYANINEFSYTQEQFDHWATNLQELADFFTNRGQHLIYLITPSKATYYPEYLPNTYVKHINNPRPDYFLKRKALQKINVPYFDASQQMLEHKAKSYGKLLFSRGGTHWTMLGASLATEKILDLIAQQTKTQLPPLSFSYSVSNRPLGADKDLLHHCKLLFPQKHYKVPQVSFKINDNPSSLKVAIIGGSFTHFLKELFAESHYFTQLDHYYYLILNHYQISKEGKKIEIPIERNNPKSYQDILSADIVILEENEILAFSNHFRELYFQLLGKYPN